MDLNTVETIVTAPTRASLAEWRPGDAWLAGGSWLFSEPQSNLRRLLDLQGFGWCPLEQDGAGLTVAATCRIAQLQAWMPPVSWEPAAQLIDRCCRALLGSFKVWNVATVGGNLCLALPAAPMAALAVALDGSLTIWGLDGEDRTCPAEDFVVGDGRNALNPGEVLRSIRLPSEALRRRNAFRQIALSPLGRSGALLIGTRNREGTFALTVTAATVRPFVLRFAVLPSESDLDDRIAGEIPGTAYHDDVHGRPDWRRHVTRLLAREIRAELA